MNQLGIGAMLGMLVGNESSVLAFTKALGKTITALKLADDSLQFVFQDGYRMSITDEGQSCCENRYMSTDDTLSDYVGAQLIGGEVADGPSVPSEYDEHDTAFLRLSTSAGTFTVVTHVEHNGYYGGFSIRAHDLGEGK